METEKTRTKGGGEHGINQPSQEQEERKRKPDQKSQLRTPRKGERVKFHKMSHIERIVDAGPLAGGVPGRQVSLSRFPSFEKPERKPLKFTQNEK